MAELPNAEARIQKVHELIKNGERGGMLIYATSLENFAQIIKSNTIPDYSATTIPYMQKLTANGEKLYFFLPMLDNLLDSEDEAIQKFGKKVRRRIGDDGDPNGAAEDYAARQGAEDRFQRESGLKISAQAIVYLVSRYLPENFAELRRYSALSSLADEGDLLVNFDDYVAEVTTVEQHYGDNLSELLEALNLAIQQTGIIIYFKESVLQRGKASLGPEDYSDVIVTTTDPLTLEDISGVEILSDGEQVGIDLRELLDLIS